MAAHGESSSPEKHCVFVETNLDTRLTFPVIYKQTISVLKKKICKEHKKMFPEVGEINILALKVKRRRQFFYLSDSVKTISMTFEGMSSNNWFMYVDAVKVEKSDLLAIMDVGKNSSNLELFEKEIGSDSLLVDENTKEPTLEGVLNTKVNKNRRKREKESLDGKRSRKKPAIDRKKSYVTTNDSLDDVEESQKLCGKDIESGEKIDVISMEEANYTLKEAVEETDLGTKELNGTDESHKSCGEVPMEQLDDLRGAEEQDLKKGDETIEDLLPCLDTARDEANESQENGNETGDKSVQERDQIETYNLASHPENHLEANIGLLTSLVTDPKKKKQKKNSKDHIHQSPSVNEINGAPEIEIDKKIDATSGSFPNSSGEKLAEKEIGDKFVDNVRPRDNLLDSGLATKPVHDSHTGKLTVENITSEHEAAKDSVELSADETKSVKSSKKKKSRKAKSPAGKEDTLSASPAQNLEPIIKVVDREEPDNVIKNVFDSSLKDDFVGGGMKQDQVTRGVKHSKKENKNLNLYPSGSIDGSLISIKPKERRGRVKPASSGTSQLQSRVNNGRRGTKIDHSSASTKVAVKNKKEAAKKIPNPVTVKKSSMNFFKDVDWDSTDDESFKRASNVSTNSPSDSSSDDDSDVTSMSRRKGKNMPGGTTKVPGSLQVILRSSRSFKEAKLRASQSQP